MKLLASLTTALLLCLPARAQNIKMTAEVLSVEVLYYRLGDKSAHCSDDGKGGTDCDIRPADSSGIWEARPGYVSSAYIELGFSDHRLISLRCEPGLFVWSNRFCFAPEKGQIVQVEFKGKHATVRWDVRTQKIRSVNKIENKLEHRSEKYEISDIARNRYFGSIPDSSPGKQ
ncbi:MAG TPA: hypothetical protein VGR94_05865 [Candidatus Acidoferrales bacterium]|nr:hypothetical protein [Candidatus Acidoferrales bacterium]